MKPTLSPPPPPPPPAAAAAAVHDSLFFRKIDPRHEEIEQKGQYGLVEMTTTATTPQHQHQHLKHSNDEHDHNHYNDDDVEQDEYHDEYHEDDNDDDNAHEEEEEGASSASASASALLLSNRRIQWYRLLFTPLFPDDRFEIRRGLSLLDGIAAVRCLKFFLVTWIGLIGSFYLVRIMVRKQYYIILCIMHTRLSFLTALYVLMAFYYFDHLVPPPPFSLIRRVCTRSTLLHCIYTESTITTISHIINHISYI